MRARNLVRETGTTRERRHARRRGRRPGTRSVAPPSPRSSGEVGRRVLASRRPYEHENRGRRVVRQPSSGQGRPPPVVEAAPTTAAVARPPRRGGARQRCSCTPRRRIAEDYGPVPLGAGVSGRLRRGGRRRARQPAVGACEAPGQEFFARREPSIAWRGTRPSGKS